MATPLTRSESATIPHSSGESSARVLAGAGAEAARKRLASGDGQHGGKSRRAAHGEGSDRSIFRRI